MAKKPSFPLKALTYGLVFLGVNFLGLLALVGLLVTTGVMDKSAFWNVLYVFRGSHTAVTTEEYREFNTLREKAERFDEILAREKGGGEVFEDAVESQREESEFRREEATVLERRLEEYRRIIENERARLENVKKELEEARAQLDLLKSNRIRVRQAEDTERLIKILSGMDPADAGVYVSNLIARGEEGVEWAARLLRLVKPQSATDILTEMPPDDRARVLPVLEDEYAGLPAGDVVKEWRLKAAMPGESMGPRQIAEHLSAMTPRKAFSVWRALDERRLREDVLDRIAPRKEDTP